MIQNEGSEAAEYLLENTAWIGRDESCQICIDHQLVSRRHAEVFFENGSWWLRDLRSRNGTYISGAPIEDTPLHGTTSLTLGKNGPQVIATAEETQPASSAVESKLLSEYADYYLHQTSTEGAGQRTLFIRQAFRNFQQKQKQRNAVVIVFTTVLLAAVGSYAFYQHNQANRQQQRAEDLFYAMKSIELDLAKSEEAVLALKGKEAIKEIRRSRFRRQELEEDYDQFLRTTGLYASQLSEEDRLILRVARIFGECELGMPRNFVAEVKRYIVEWRSTDRLKNAIADAERHGYASRIASAMLSQDLPPQFFYLALQESNFNPYAIGRRTSKGIAKGMWQFIPDTAMKYGLRLGPLYDLSRPDPADERHNFEKSTQAAARYLRSIYTADAQASALLVMASYNWGEGKVGPLMQKLPANPHDRNFWRLLSVFRDRIPQETYDYVFHIVAAAVIGENPRLFGFDFENPLRNLERGADD